MITVGGFNSAIDRSMETDELRPGEVMRVKNVATANFSVDVVCTCKGWPAIGFDGS